MFRATLKWSSAAFAAFLIGCAPPPTAAPIPAATLVPVAPSATAAFPVAAPTPRPSAPPVTVVPTPNADVSFKRDVLPIFQGICSKCHAGPNPVQHLDLQSFAGVMKGGDSGTVIRPRDPDNSILVRYIRINFMPFGDEPKLTKEEKQKIVNWVAAGAPDN